MFVVTKNMNCLKKKNDATLKRHFAAFINERDSKSANCVFSFNGGKNIIEIRTNREVKINDEATISYTAQGNKATYKISGAIHETHGYQLSDYPPPPTRKRKKD